PVGRTFRSFPLAAGDSTPVPHHSMGFAAAMPLGVHSPGMRSCRQDNHNCRLRLESARAALEPVEIAKRDRMIEGCGEGRSPSARDVMATQTEFVTPDRHADGHARAAVKFFLTAAGVVLLASLV